MIGEWGAVNMTKQIKDLGPIQLWRLRKDIVLNSLYLTDYENRYGVDPQEVYNFFDGWLEFLEEDMREEIPDYKEEDFFVYIDLFDTPKNLLNWWFCWVG